MASLNPKADFYDCFVNSVTRVWLFELKFRFRCIKLMQWPLSPVFEKLTLNNLKNCIILSTLCKNSPKAARWAKHCNIWYTIRWKSAKPLRLCSVRNIPFLSMLPSFAPKPISNILVPKNYHCCVLVCIYRNAIFKL